MWNCYLDAVTARLWVTGGATAKELSPLWLRELSMEESDFDRNNGQRLYDPATLPPDLGIVAADLSDGAVTLRFSDGHSARYPLDLLAVSAGLAADPLALPAPVAWTAESLTPPRITWESLDDEAVYLDALGTFFTTGLLILTGTPAAVGALEGIAARFGPVRETDWGRLFNVRTVANANDLAYTGLKLTAHTDNPYRRNVPGIQFLHCLENAATGGESIVIDGYALSEALKQEAPDLHAVASTLPVSFRYDGARMINRYEAPMLMLKQDGTLAQIRLSTRLDFPPAADAETLDLFYRARRRLSELAADPLFEVRFRLRPGDCLMMDNHRTLHGRTAFAADGPRFLQGCYIDHDGPESQYRLLTRNRSLQASAAIR